MKPVYFSLKVKTSVIFRLSKKAFTLTLLIILKNCYRLMFSSLGSSHSGVCMVGVIRYIKIVKSHARKTTKERRKKNYGTKNC